MYCIITKCIKNIAYYFDTLQASQLKSHKTFQNPEYDYCPSFCYNNYDEKTFAICI